MLSGRCAWWLSILLVCAACEDPSLPPPAIWVDPATVPPEVDCTATPNLTVCEGDWSGTCGAAGDAKGWVNCALLEQSCVPNLGCRVCAPNLSGCTEDNSLFRCNAAGDDYEVVQTCEVGTVCNASASGCVDLCAAAEDTRSYVGCEYWAVTSSNSLLDANVDASGAPTLRVFNFEIVISNPHDIAAEVEIEQPGTPTRTVTVEPHDVQRVVLPWVEELVGRFEAHTTHAVGAAFHITSSVPVTVYQFNPMEFSHRFNSIAEFSFTNDASLLLPAHVLTGNYLVMSREALGVSARDVATGEVGRYHLPGFVAIVGAEDRDVDVEVTSSAFTMASPNGNVPALMPGQVAHFLLAKGDVLQLQTASPDDCALGPEEEAGNDGLARRYCMPDPEYDLTGTVLRADGRVAVFGGHDCARVPFDVAACDHLEESVFPEDVWGKRVPIAVTAPLGSDPQQPNVVRVLSSHDNNTVTFQPSVHPDVVLNRGEHMEFLSTRDVVVTGTEALLVAQLLVGQHFGTPPASVGDPAMVLGIPQEQWRNSYAFTTPSTYEGNFVNVIAPSGAPISLDDRAISTWTPIEGTDLATARVSVSAGQHRMTGAATFGITAYGYATFTSYAYPGGLDLRVINGPD